MNNQVKIVACYLRMAVKSQRGAREAIQHLSSIIADCTVPKVPSETFRQAKFNKDEATDVLWTLLLNVVQLLKFLQSNSSHSGDIRESLRCYSLPHASSNRKTATLVVKANLLSMCYCRPQFFSLSPLSGSGSRELLLAFGWMLHESQLIKRLSTYHLEAASVTSIPLRPSKVSSVRGTLEESESLKREMSQIIDDLSQCTIEHREIQSGDELRRVDECLQRLAWVRGKLLAKYKSTHSSRVSYLRLTHRLHTNTDQQGRHSSDGSTHLNVHELFLLRHPDQLCAHLKKVEYHLSCLQRLVEWQLYDNVFWQWMESVHDLYKKESALLLEEQKQVEQEGDLNGCEHNHAILTETESLESLNDKVRRLEREITNVLGRHTPYMEKLHRLWRMKAKSVCHEEVEQEHNQTEQDMESLVLKTNPDIQSKLSGVKHATCTIERLNQLDRAIYLADTDSKRDKASIRTSVALGYTMPVHKQHTTKLLLQESQKFHAHILSQLEVTRSHIQQYRENIQRQLHLREQQFPTTMCKVEK